MTWIKLDDGWSEHTTIVTLSDAAKVAYIEGLCHCSRNLTDGFIPEAVVDRMWKPKVVKELTDAGLWQGTNRGVIVADYLNHQRSRAQVEAERDSARVRANKRRNNAGSSAEVRMPESEAETDTPTSRPVQPRLGSTTGGPGRKADSLVSVPDCAECGDSGWVDHPVTGDAVRCTCELGATA